MDKFERLVAYIKKTAEKPCKCDKADFDVYDYSGGNFDDAYEIGLNDGEISYARIILKAAEEMK